MSKLTMTTFVSLDGVMQAPGGPNEDPSGGFAYGGWVVPYFDADGGAFVVEVFRRASAFLLGRKTYEIFAGHWPRVKDQSDPIATALNKLPKYVASTTLTSVTWNNAKLLHGDVANAVRALKGEHPGELQVHGSRGLAQTLLRHGLVDELNLIQFPVVLGKGKRLFGPEGRPAAMKLVSTKTTGKGVLISTYRFEGMPAVGSFELPD
ncbi:MAG: dihydrofolate reductase family protein [Deltaproteobacteria bacterium]|nr:dihydrofolate reductase family protein [Deltaproteobacteria bacterium]